MAGSGDGIVQASRSHTRVSGRDPGVGGLGVWDLLQSYKRVWRIPRIWDHPGVCNKEMEMYQCTVINAFYLKVLLCVCALSTVLEIWTALHVCNLITQTTSTVAIKNVQTLVRMIFNDIM